MSMFKINIKRYQRNKLTQMPYTSTCDYIYGSVLILKQLPIIYIM